MPESYVPQAGGQCRILASPGLGKMPLSESAGAVFVLVRRRLFVSDRCARSSCPAVLPGGLPSGSTNLGNSSKSERGGRETNAGDRRRHSWDLDESPRALVTSGQELRVEERAR